MRRKFLYASLPVLALAAVIAWTLTRSSANQGDPNAPAQNQAKAATPLPIGQVILFNSGVGYFERQGQVAGDARVELSFLTSDVNDLLKSLVLQDTAGGHVEAISFDSQDPVEKILHSFALDLNNNPTFGQILYQARGEKIELLRQKKPGDEPAKVIGTIIGIESHREMTGKDAAVDVQQVNLLTAEGMLAVSLTQVLSVRFLNPTLENEFQRALHVLAGAHDVQKKAVSLRFTGNGKRAVKVGYVVERPIWKTSYRLVSEPNGKLFMQGWAIVENTSDDDWNNVRMVLVSGKPISFRMDLYSPLYVQRPLVEPELFASLRPPLYGSSFGDRAEKAVPSASLVFGQNGTGNFGGFGGGGKGGGGGSRFARIEGSPVIKTYTVPGGNAAETAKVLQEIYRASPTLRITAIGDGQIMVYAPPADQSEIAMYLEAVRAPGNDTVVLELKDANATTVAGWLNDRFSHQNGPTIKADTYRNAIVIMGSREQVKEVKDIVQIIEGRKAASEPKLPYAIQPLPDLGAVFMQSNHANDVNKMLLDAKLAGSAIAGLNFKEGVQSIASASDVGDYFQYVIDQKISLARQKSAMLPILNQSIEGAKVSIYNEAVHAKFPLLGLRLKNTSGKPLTQGPITVYDDGSYAGDTRMLDLQPNEERLLSYALDLGTEVKATVESHPAHDMALNLGGTSVTAVYTIRETKIFTAKNRSTHDRTLIIEHPIRGDWKLVDPKKPSDQSRDVYRFQIDVKAGATVKLDVAEEQSRTDPLALLSNIADLPPFYAVGNAFIVVPQTSTTGGKLLSLSIHKGVLEATYKERTSKTYFIQNQSEHDHGYTVNHIIAKDWKRLNKDGKDVEVGPAIFTFKVEVKSKEATNKEVLEERVYQDRTQVLAKLDDDVLRKLIAHGAPAANVKAALQQVLTQRAGLQTATQELADLKAALGVLTQDQARVRENLKIVPQTSEHYEGFLKKFVAQETQIEEAQRQIRTQEGAVQKMQKEYETFVAGLTVQ